jgi:hypothetical protein
VPRALPRTLTVRSLDAHGLPTGAAVRVGSDVGATARLAGAPDGRVVASWMRPQKIRSYAGEDRGDAPPPSAYIAPRAFTRQLLPRLAPARPLGGPSEIAAGVPSVGFDGPGHAVAALRASAPAVGPAYDARLSGSAGGGPWSSSRLVAHLGFSRLDPVVTVPSPGDAVVVYTALIPAPGTPVWSVGAADATGTQALGVTNAGDGRGIAVARAADRVLVAWPSAGGVQVAERSGA